MILRKFQIATPCTKPLRTATSGCLIAEFQPISLRVRSRPMSSKKTGSSMSLQEKIQFLHNYSACDVCLHLNRLPGVKIWELTASGLGHFTEASEASTG